MKKYIYEIKATVVSEYETETGKLSDSKVVNAEARTIFAHLGLDIKVREAMVALYLDRANNVIGSKLIGLGGVSGVSVDPKLVMKGALDLLASCIILVHNHPSGTMRPSREDLKLTDKIKKGCSFLDMSFLDHLILMPSGEYYSMADSGDI